MSVTQKETLKVEEVSFFFYYYYYGTLLKGPVCNIWLVFYIGKKLNIMPINT